MMITQLKRYGQIEVTQDFMNSGDVPKMLYELQATPTAVEYDYMRNTFRMILTSPQLPKVAEGVKAPHCTILLNQLTEKFEFDL